MTESCSEASVGAPAPGAPLTRAALARLDAHWREVDAIEDYAEPGELLDRVGQLEAEVLEACALELGSACASTVDEVRRWLG